MSVPESWKERAALHEQAQKKLRASLRQEFPFAAKCGDELRAAGFKDARVVEAFENGNQHGEPIETVGSTEVLAMLRDNAQRQKRKGKE